MFINDIFKKKLKESLRDGEHYTFQVFFDDGTDETLNFSSDDIDWDRVGAKRGKQVVDVKRQGGIRGSQTDTPHKPHDFPDDRGLARAQRAYDKQLPEGGFDIPEIPRAPTPKPPKEKDVKESSVQDKLHRRHQDLRKKSGLPDPDYYQELKASYDIDDDAKRLAQQAEIKKKYKVAEGNLQEFAPGDGNNGRWYSDDDLADIVGEDWYEFDLSHEMGNISTQGERARIFLAQQAEAYLNDRGYNVNVLDVRDQGDNLSWYISGSLMNEQGVAEGLPQTLRKVVPGYAKREIDKKMDAGKFGKTDADKDANFQRYKKIQDKLKEQSVAEGSETAADIDKKIEFHKQGQAAAQYKGSMNKMHAKKIKELLAKKEALKQGVAEAGPFSYGAKKPRKGSVADLAAKKRQEQEKSKKPIEPRDQMVGTARIVTNEDVERYLEEMTRAGYDIVTEAATMCPECGGVAYENEMLAEKQDACYHKVKSRYKVWPSAYASGALVRCRKVGAKNWGNKSKK